MEFAKERALPLKENLADAGCDANLAEQIMRSLDEGHLDEALTMLSEHRQVVLAHCHAEQKKIDCLDYLVYRLKKGDRRHGNMG